MTSINALRFDDYSGVMMCDVQRSWNPEDMILFVSDKIKPFIPPEITEETGLVAAYGNTGTSTVGDELKFTLFKKLREEYRNLKEKNSNQIPKTFKTMEKLSEMAYDIIRNMKHTHISQQLKSLYGFDSIDYLRGYYEDEERKIEIKDKEILAECEKLITWKGSPQEVRAVFVNAGILAGYEDREGFRIFQFSIWRLYREPVEVAFVAGGSGSDIVQHHMTDFLSHKSLLEKRGNIDPVEGCFELLYALNTACERNYGIGGYYNIILFDGKAPHDRRMIEINDHRAKLASEIALAQKEDFISTDTARGLLGTLLFHGGSFEETSELLLKNCNDPKKLLYRLRGYKRGQ